MSSLKPVAIALLGTALATGCATAGTPAPAPAGDDKEASLLTRYTLSRCLGTAFPDTAIEGDAGAAAGGYLQLGSLPIEVYEEATTLAKEAASRTYHGKHGEPLHVMKCLDLLDSPELERLIDRNVR